MLSKGWSPSNKTGWIVAAVLFSAFLIVVGTSEYVNRGTSDTPAANADVLFYKASIQGEIAKLQGSMTTFSALTKTPRVTDPDWKQQVNAQFGAWHEVYGEAQALHVPPCLADAHRKWLAALSHIDLAASDGSAGEAQLSAPLILQATGELDRGTSLLADANTAIKHTDC